MEMTVDMAQRVAIVMEQNKSGTWSVASYLVTGDGERYRRSLAIRPTYPEASEALKAIWERMALPPGVEPGGDP